MHRHKRNLVRVGLVIVLCMVTGVLHAQGITGADVKKAMDKGVEFLERTQAANGSWPYHRNRKDGATALVALALLTCDVPADDPVVKKAVNFVVDSKDDQTYCVALKAMLLAQVDPKKYDNQIQKAANWLSEAQNKAGAWTYGRAHRNQRWYDNSNTQYAVLGLFAAEAAGARVHRRVWEKVQKHFTNSMTDDGGWGYSGRGRQRATHSMTCAGVGSLYMAGVQLLRPTAHCGKYEQDSRIQLGLNWLGRNWKIEGPDNYHHLYYLYGMERMGMVGARKYINGHDWYREGAEFLLGIQQQDGNWGGVVRGPNSVQNQVVATAFALLFLGKGRAPAMISQVQYVTAKGDKDAWHLHPYALRNLTAKASELFETPASWQVLRLGDPLDELVRVPILYINGHDAIKLNDLEKKRLREYVEQGGTVVSVACCANRHFGFDRSMRALYKELFPDRELEELDKDHAVYSAFHKVKHRKTLLGINFGCRTAIFHSVDRLSCTWQGERTRRPEENMELGINICAYATGMEPLLDKLDEVKLVKVPGGAPSAEVLRGALVLAQLKYAGRWDNDKQALVNLMVHLRTRAGMDVANKRKVLTFGDPDLYTYPIVYLTGSRNIKFDDDVTKRMREFLDRGGFLFIDSTCGNQGFTDAMRDWLKRLYPEAELKVLPADHELYRTGFRVDKVTYKPQVLKDKPDFDEPYLEAIEQDGRVKVVFSPYDIGCALAGFRGDCPGYTVESAFDVATAIVTYAMVK